MIRVSVQTDDFDAGAELALLEALGGGAVSSFIGVVRADGEQSTALELETYQAMAEVALRRIAETAMARWPMLGVRIVHRYGVLPIGERIVFIGTASRHRQAALEATAFLIDWAKTRAPFWKRAWNADGTGRWIEAREADELAAAQWE